ncbi:MAG: hypothetical protein ACRDJI_02530 [Actinomycetota bacterium]
MGPPGSGADVVRAYLRAQNLEQLGRFDEAIVLYERAVASGFDATGPYDRLIALYADRAAHREVVRIADLALVNVRTHEDKREWYRGVRARARQAAADVPQAAPKPPRE